LPSVLDLALPISEIPQYVKMLHYSDTGAGKTQFAYGAPNPTWIDFERSFETLRTLSDGDKVKVLMPTSFDQVKKYVADAIKVFDTIVFDTISSMQVFYMNEFVAEMVADTTLPKRNDKYVRYEGDYNYATNELTDFFLMLQNAPVNIIFNAHSKVIYTKNDKGQDTTTIYKIMPDITPAVWGKIKAFVNVVAYTEKLTVLGKPDEPIRKMYLNSTNQIQAKNRLGIQKQSIDNPTFKDVFK
jgi:hypothetical protein